MERGGRTEGGITVRGRGAGKRSRRHGSALSGLGPGKRKKRRGRSPLRRPRSCRLLRHARRRSATAKTETAVEEAKMGRKGEGEAGVLRRRQCRFGEPTCAVKSASWRSASGQGGGRRGD